MSDLPHRWVCQTCGHTIKMSVFHTSIDDVHVEVTKCVDPDCYGERGKGKRAGIIRNLQMLDESPELVIAFWDEKSTGTKHTIDEAQRRGVRVDVIALGDCTHD